jgi:hypothetical protein
MTEPKESTVGSQYVAGNSIEEHTMDTQIPQDTAGDEKELQSRRNVLKTLITAGTLVPLSSKLAAGQVSQKPEPEQAFSDTRRKEISELSINGDRAKIAALIIDRVATDPEFRKLVKAQPVSTLRTMGITLNSDAQEALEVLSAEDPDVLIKAMLGEEFPSTEGFAAIPGVAVSIRVATRPATQPAVQVGVNVAVGIRTSVTQVAAENYVNALSVSLTGEPCTPLEPESNAGSGSELKEE